MANSVSLNCTLPSPRPPHCAASSLASVARWPRYSAREDEEGAAAEPGLWDNTCTAHRSTIPGPCIRSTIVGKIQCPPVFQGPKKEKPPQEHPPTIPLPPLSIHQTASGHNLGTTVVQHHNLPTEGAPEWGFSLSACQAYPCRPG